MHTPKITFTHQLNILIHGVSNQLWIIMNTLLNSKNNKINEITLRNINNFALVLLETDGITEITYSTISYIISVLSI